MNQEIIAQILAVQRAVREAGVDHVDARDIANMVAEANQHVPPYEWKHGWMPLAHGTAVKYHKKNFERDGEMVSTKSSGSVKKKRPAKLQTSDSGGSSSPRSSADVANDIAKAYADGDTKRAQELVKELENISKGDQQRQDAKANRNVVSEVKPDTDARTVRSMVRNADELEKKGDYEGAIKELRLALGNESDRDAKLEIKVKIGKIDKKKAAREVSDI